MKFVADEGVDGPIVARLRRDGHEVVYIAELVAGVDDEEVLARAHELSAPLISTDKDFGELVFRQRRSSSGVILVRLVGLSTDDKAEIVGDVVTRHADELLGAFIVIAPGLVRIRRAPALGK